QTDTGMHTPVTRRQSRLDLEIRGLGDPLAAAAGVEGAVVAPQLGQCGLDIAFFLLEVLDLRPALVAAKRQRRRLGVALARPQLANFSQGEAQPLALKNQRQPLAILLAINAGHALPTRLYEAFALVKSQRSQRDVKLSREIAYRIFVQTCV